MTDKVVILVTVANRREGRQIARHLVKNRLAACVNMTPTIQSIYRWEGKLVEDKEYLLLIKSARPLFPEIKTAITQIHTYHTPEIICLPIIEGSENYLQWISDSVKVSGEKGEWFCPRRSATRNRTDVRFISCRMRMLKSFKHS